MCVCMYLANMTSVVRREDVFLFDTCENNLPSVVKGLDEEEINKSTMSLTWFPGLMTNTIFFFNYLNEEAHIF